jgi:pimeloyl-ACP methyl ester carboxylesterase
VRQLQKPGALRGGFSHFASVFDDTETFKGYGARKIEAPVLAVGGDRGAGGFLQYAFANLASNATIDVVPNCGHWVAEEQPAHLTKSLIGFLTS